MLGASRALKRMTTGGGGGGTQLPSIILTANTTSGSSIYLSWIYNKAIDGPTTPNFRITRSPTSAVYTTLATQTGLTYTDNTVTAGQTYYYIIEFDYTPVGGSLTTIQSNVVQILVTVSVPDAPGNFTAVGEKIWSGQVYSTQGTLISNTTQGKVTFTWTKPNTNGSSLTKYILQQAFASNPTNFVQVREIDASLTTITTPVILMGLPEGQANQSIFRLLALNSAGASVPSSTVQTTIWRYSGVQYLMGSGTWQTTGRYVRQMVFVAGGGGGGYHAAGGGGGGGEAAITTSSFDAVTVLGSSPIPYEIGIGGAGGTVSSGANGGDTYFGPTTNRLTFKGGGGGGGGETDGNWQNGKTGGSGGGGGRFFYGSNYLTNGGASEKGTGTLLSVTRYGSSGFKGFDSPTGYPSPALQSGGAGGGPGPYISDINGNTNVGPGGLPFTYADGSTAFASAGGDGGTWTYPDHSTSVAGATQAYAGSGGGGGKSYTAGSAGRDGIIVVEYWY